jgi:integrase
VIAKTFSFTKSSITALPPADPGTRDMYYDERIPHLAVRVTATGTKTFLVYKWSEGTPIKRVIGKFPHVTVEQARLAAAEISVSLNWGTDPLALRRARREEITLGQLFERYFELYAQSRLATAQEMRSNFTRRFGEWLSRRVSSIKRTDVQSKINALAEGGHLHRANRAHDDLRAVFSWGIKQGLMDNVNPCIGIARFKTQSRQRFITPTEFESFMTALRKETNIKLRDYFYLSLFTGARQSNVLAMRWDQIDFELAIWNIPKTKNGESHTVPLTSLALEVLEGRRPENTLESPWVFPGSGSTGHLIEPKAAWKRVLKEAKLENLRVHDLRRTLGSYMAMSNQSLQIIGKALGHRSPTSTMVYARLANDPVRNAMQAAQYQMLTAAGIAPPEPKNVVPLHSTKTRTKKQ